GKMKRRIVAGEGDGGEWRLNECPVGVPIFPGGTGNSAPRPPRRQDRQAASQSFCDGGASYLNCSASALFSWRPWRSWRAWRVVSIDVGTRCHCPKDLAHPVR